METYLRKPSSDRGGNLRVRVDGLLDTADSVDDDGSRLVGSQEGDGRRSRLS